MNNKNEIICTSFEDVSSENFFLLNNNNITIIHQNIRSVNKNFDQLLLQLNQLKDLPQIIILSEIWISDNEVNFFKIQGYNCIYKCNDRQQSAGVMIYIHKNLNINSSSTNIFKTADSITVELKVGKTLLKILCLYRLHSYLIKEFIDELETVLDIIGSRNCIIIGDLNININNKENQSIDIKRYLMIMAYKGFESYINSNTRITAHSETCIDHIFIRAQDLINISAAVFHLGITDHSLTAIKFQVDNYKHERKSLNFKQPIIDYNKFEKKITKTDWDYIYNISEIDKAYDTFSNYLTKSIEEAVTIKTRSKLSKIKLNKPWFTDKIIKMVKKRNKINRKLTKEPFNKELVNKFSNIKNQINLEIKQEKSNYTQTALTQAGNNTKLKWDILNSITHRNKNKEIESIKIKINNQVLTNNIEICNIFNNNFINISNQITMSSANNLTKHYSDNLNIEHFTQLNNTNTFLMNPTHEYEVAATINALPNKKSTGFDKVPTTLLKKISKSISPVISHLINLSIASGIYPKLLKKSLIVPIFKSGNKEDINNYRPIALVSVVSKVFERIINRNLLNFLYKNNFFSKNQFGFLKNCNTEKALLNFTSNIYTNINDGKKSAGLFLDVKKAFDTLDREILLEKLDKAGVRGICNKWFRSYLTNRDQAVKIGNTVGDWKVMNSGVPQGCALSATLFLVYCNDLCNGKFAGKLTAFADDTALLYSDVSWDLLNKKIENDLELLKLWFHYNKLRLNIDKTKIMYFACRKKDIPSTLMKPIKFHNNECCNGNNNNECTCPEIKKTFEQKYLGLILDSEMTWHAHINHLYKACLIANHAIYYLKDTVDINTKKMFYFAFYHSKIEYGLAVWGGSYKSHLKPILIGQKKAIRNILLSNRYEPSFPLFRFLGILPLRYLYVYKVLKEFFERSHCFGIQYYTKFTRNTCISRLKLPKVNKCIFKTCFLYIGPAINNKLPDYIKNYQNLKGKLKLLKRWLLENKETVEEILCTANIAM